mmetsp:Transcript_18121/g.50322  ORF Transcript_18121/g.50322 Transcript_18121/m.50322 type:complete len:315 (+) Transcript_18121:1-945(+)
MAHLSWVRPRRSHPRGGGGGGSGDDLVASPSDVATSKRGRARKPRRLRQGDGSQEPRRGRRGRRPRGLRDLAPGAPGKNGGVAGGGAVGLPLGARPRPQKRGRLPLSCSVRRNGAATVVLGIGVGGKAAPKGGHTDPQRRTADVEAQALHGAERLDLVDFRQVDQNVAAPLALLRKRYSHGALPRLRPLPPRQARQRRSAEDGGRCLDEAKGVRLGGRVREVLDPHRHLSETPSALTCRRRGWKGVLLRHSAGAFGRAAFLGSRTLLPLLRCTIGDVAAVVRGGVRVGVDVRGGSGRAAAGRAEAEVGHPLSLA